MQEFPVTPPISLDAAIERIKDFCNSQLPAEEFARALKRRRKSSKYPFRKSFKKFRLNSINSFSAEF
jgi:hypothetical protein